MIRELIWLEIQKNPGRNTRQIEEALGRSRNSIASYIAQLLKAKLIRRRRVNAPSTNVCGTYAYYTFFVTQETYTWVDARRSPPPQPSSDISIEAWIAQLPDLRVSEVLKLRTAIDKALSV